MNNPARALLLAAACAALAAPARAETLAEAMATAYGTNPTLLAQRATQRALDETYVQARAGWRPTVQASVQAYYQHTDFGRGSSGTTTQASGLSTGASGGGGTQAGAGAAGAVATGSTGASSITSTIVGSSAADLNYGSGQIAAVQPLYTGGRVAAEVRAADASVRAGRQALRLAEITVLQQVVAAYVDVRRDQAILAIRGEATTVLASQAEEAAAKFQVGQVTRTDVSQARANLAAAQGQQALSRAQLAVSRATYAAVVGRPPGELAPEPPLPGLPAIVDQAFDAAEAGAPSLLQAQLAEASSRATIAAVRANLRPTVSAQASYGAQGVLSPFAARDFDRVATAELVFSQPLFTGGLDSSLIRQALARNTADRISIETARRATVQAVSQAWETLQGQQAAVAADVAGLLAAQQAFSGIREQYRVGLSSTLDVLIQQQTLESAQLALAAARHDAYLAQAQLLAAMGRLDAADLVAGVDLYDPMRAFDRVKRRGATPWEPLIAALDGVAGPSDAPEPPAPRPVAAGPVEMRAADGVARAREEMSAR